jgi:hypothetical protein
MLKALKDKTLVGRSGETFGKRLTLKKLSEHVQNICIMAKPELVLNVFRTFVQRQTSPKRFPETSKQRFFNVFDISVEIGSAWERALTIVVQRVELAVQLNRPGSTPGQHEAKFGRKAFEN